MPPRSTGPSPTAKKIRAQAKEAQANKPDLLDVGDAVEHSISAQVRIAPGKEVWVKMGAVVHVRPGETAAQADERATEFVTESLNDKIQALLD